DRTDVPQAEYPVDYRQRHPIVVRQGEGSIEVLIGRNRGGLTPSQRADVLAFAQNWQRESGSGIVIEIPRGGPTDRAAADSMREIRSIFAAVGVPSNAIYTRDYHPRRTALGSIKISYSKMVAGAGRCGDCLADLRPSLESIDFSHCTSLTLCCAYQI